MWFHNIAHFTDRLDDEMKQWSRDMPGHGPGGINHPQFIPKKFR